MDTTSVKASGGDVTGALMTRALTGKPTQFSPDTLMVEKNLRDSSSNNITPTKKKLEHSMTRAAPKHVVRNSLLAGSISGMSSTVALYPMDLVRTNMQAAGNGSGLSGGPFQVLRQTVQMGGLRALYTGFTLPLVAQAVYKGTVFSVNNTLEQAILSYKRNNSMGEGEAATSLTMPERGFCGFVAGAVNGGLFVTPVEYVRNQLIAQQAKLAQQMATTNGAPASGAVGTPWGVISHAIRVDGVHTLWRGVRITIVRDGFGVACFFSAMALTQNFLLRATTASEEQLEAARRNPAFWIRIVSGGMAGLAYWVASLPLDTVKTWVQTSDPSMQAVSPWRAVREIYADHGLMGVVGRLNRGWQVAYGRGIPSAAITMGVYSYAYQALQQYDG